MSRRTFVDDLSAAASSNPERIAVVAGDDELTCGELDRRVTALAAVLRGRGIGRGDRVATLLPNGIEAAVAIYGVLRSGAAFSPVNPTIKAERLTALLADLGAAAVICDEQRSAVAHEAAGSTPVIDDLGALGAPGGSDAADAGPAPGPLEIDLAAVIYTSGSTGDAKGVTLSHRNMAFVADSIIDYLRIGPEDRILCVLPLSFNYGLYHLLMSIRTGATLVLEPGFQFPGRVVGLLAEQRITGLPGVPTVFQTLLSLRGIGERDYPHLRFVTNAGAALPEATVRGVRATFPDADLFLMYGLTEATRVAYLPPALVDEHPTAVGLAIPGTEAWVGDESGQPLPAGEVGELFVRGAHVMQGYWNDPEGSAERLHPGRWPWERTLGTNDLFRLDDEGLLHFVSRRDDVIKSGGEKVAPREVEEVLTALDGVAQAAVVGVADELLGESVRAHVTAAEGVQLDPARLRRECAGHLETHKVPREIVIEDELPRTPNGKVDRLALAGLRPRAD